MKHFRKIRLFINKSVCNLILIEKVRIVIRFSDGKIWTSKFEKNAKSLNFKNSTQIANSVIRKVKKYSSFSWCFRMFPCSKNKQTHNQKIRFSQSNMQKKRDFEYFKTDISRSGYGDPSINNL